MAFESNRGGAMAGVIEDIYLAREGGAPVERVEEVEALKGCGLEGDRYCSGTGHWSRFERDCEVTFVEAEDLDRIGLETGLRVENGEHRRNIVTRGVSLKDLRRARFRVGEAVFGYGKPCSVCRHVERLTEPGMAQALKGRGGMCARVLKGGRVRSGDAIVASW
jgi:MOSC domain-containing protein YiiM